MSTEHMEELNDQQIVRREKMAALREQGIDPFGKRFERTANSQELKDKFADLDKEQLHDKNETATIAKNDSSYSILSKTRRIPCQQNIWKN